MHVAIIGVGRVGQVTAFALSHEPARASARATVVDVIPGLAKQLRVPVNNVEGYVAGEHGENDVFLWSTVRIKGEFFDEYRKKRNVNISKDKIVNAVHEITESILENLGGTMYGPATAFRDIVRAIALNTHSLLSVGIPYKTTEISEHVHVNIPLKLGMSIGPTIEHALTGEERRKLGEAAKAIYNTYKIASGTASLL